MNLYLKKTVLSFVLLISFLTGKSQCNSTFSTRSNYVVNYPQVDITSADFNNDGELDLATANYSSGCISVCYGSSNGVFSAASIFSANILIPFRIQSADFNSDGNMDLVMTNTNKNLLVSSNPNGNMLSILLGNGTGSFSPAVNYTVANNSYGIVVEDFNSDNVVDIVLTNGTSIVQLLLGTGTGSFLPAITFTTLGNPFSVISKDFNGDGFPDLALPGRGTDVGILLGTGTGSFSAPTSISTFPKNSMHVVSNDLNNDGILDLIVEGNGSGSSLFYLFFGAGDGTFSFQTTASFVALNGLSDLETADLNQDGIEDIVFTNINGTLASFMHGSGSGSFSGGGLITGSAIYPNAIATADFNHDGRVDLAFSNSLINQLDYISVLLNTTIYPTVGIVASSTLICAGETVTLNANGAQSYTWSTGSDTTFAFVNPGATTSFSAIGQGTNGCVSSAAITVSVVVCNSLDLVGEEHFSINIFPNPSNNEINIKAEQELFLVLINELGEYVKEIKLNEENNFKSTLTGLADGIYFLKSDTNKILTRKIVVIH